MVMMQLMTLHSYHYLLLQEGCISQILIPHHYLCLRAYLFLTCFVAHVDILCIEACVEELSVLYCEQRKIGEASHSIEKCRIEAAGDARNARRCC